MQILTPKTNRRLDLSSLCLGALAVVLLAGCQEPRAVGELVQDRVQGNEIVLWLVCQDELKSRGYKLDRVDRRTGTITTQPRVGSVWYEIWADDVVGTENQVEANLQLVRRTIRLKIEPREDQSYQLACAVHVERLVPQPARVTGTVRAQSIFQDTAKGMLALREDAQDEEQWVRLGQDAQTAHAIIAAIQERM